MLHVWLRTVFPCSWLTLCFVAVGCQGQSTPAAQSGGSSGSQAVEGEAGASGGRAGADSIAGAGAQAAGGASGVTGGVGAAGQSAGSGGVVGARAGSGGQAGGAAVGGGAGDAGNRATAGTGGAAGHSGRGGEAGNAGAGGAAGHAGAGGASGAGGSGASTMAAVQAIFDAHCTTCHDATNTHPPGFAALPLTADNAHAALVSQPATETCGGTLVVPGNSASSYLVHKLTDNPPCDGSHMPRPFEVGPMLSLSADELKTVRGWIDSGAPP